MVIRYETALREPRYVVEGCVPRSALLSWHPFVSHWGGPSHRHGRDEWLICRFVHCRAPWPG